MTKDLENALELLRKAKALLGRQKHFDALSRHWPQIKLVIERLTDVEEGLEQVILNVEDYQNQDAKRRA